MLMEIISIILGVILLGTCNFGSGAFELGRLVFLLDPPSFIIVLVFTVPVLLKGSVWKDFKRAWRLLKKDYTCHLSDLRRTLDVVEMMQKQVLYGGAVCVLMTFITILTRLTDLASLGPNLAVAIISMLYALFFEMILLPLQLEAKRRIIDYMEMDTDVENMSAATGGGNRYALTRKESRENGERQEQAESEKAGIGEEKI